MKLAFVASSLSTQIEEEEELRVGSDSEECVPVERNVYPHTVMSVSQHYTNPTKYVALVNGGDHHHQIKL